VKLVQYKLEVNSTLAGVTVRQEARYEEEQPTLLVFSNPTGQSALVGASPGFERAVCNCVFCRAWERR